MYTCTKGTFSLILIGHWPWNLSAGFVKETESQSTRIPTSGRISMLLSPLLLPALLQPQALAPALPRRASPVVACMPPSEMKLAAPHASRGCSSEKPSPWSFDGSSEAGSVERPLVVLTCMAGAAAHSACHTLVAELVETIIDGRDAGKSWLRPIASRRRQLGGGAAARSRYRRLDNLHH